LAGAAAASEGGAGSGSAAAGVGSGVAAGAGSEGGSPSGGCSGLRPSFSDTDPPPMSRRLGAAVRPESSAPGNCQLSPRRLNSDVATPDRLIHFGARVRAIRVSPGLPQRASRGESIDLRALSRLSSEERWRGYRSPRPTSSASRSARRLWRRNRIHTSVRAGRPTKQSDRLTCGLVRIRLPHVVAARVSQGPGPRPPRSRYSALTAAVSAARPSFASANNIPVFSFVYSSLSMPA
jgi:hypothetical protein